MTGRPCYIVIGDSLGLKLIVVPIDSICMRRSLINGSRKASHASRARAGRSRQRQSKWADSTRLVHQNGAGNSAVSNTLRLGVGLIPRRGHRPPIHEAREPTPALEAMRIKLRLVRRLSF